MTTLKSHLYVETGAASRPTLLADLMREWHYITSGLSVSLTEVRTGKGSWKGVQSPMARLSIYSNETYYVAERLADTFHQESVLVATPDSRGDYVRVPRDIDADDWTQLDGMGQPRYTYVTADKAGRFADTPRFFVSFVPSF